jgi:hypothetical protein
LHRLQGDHIQSCDKQGKITVNGVPLNAQDYLYPGRERSTAKTTEPNCRLVER